jgi:hypothetical protein
LIFPIRGLREEEAGGRVGGRGKEKTGFFLFCSKMMKMKAIAMMVGDFYY